MFSKASYDLNKKWIWKIDHRTTYLFVFVQNAYEKPVKGKLEMANFSFL